jgi:hypothetical protein
MRNVLVMGQLALSLVTLTAAGMFVRSALESAVADPGFSFDRGIVVNVDPGLAGRSADDARQFYARALERVRAMPGITSASYASLIPFGEFTNGREVQRAGAPLRATRSADSRSMGVSTGGDGQIEGLVDAVTTAIGADYFKTVGLPLVRGEEFSATQEVRDGGDRVAIIDAARPGARHRSRPDDQTSIARTWRSAPHLHAGRTGLSDVDVHPRPILGGLG